MKKILLIFVSLLLLFGCTDADMAGNGSVTVGISSAKGISPIDMEAAKYVVTASNTAKNWNDKIEIAGASSGTFSEVPSGSVDIKAEAFNADGISIGESVVFTVTVYPGKNTPCTVIVDEHSGSGTLRVKGFVPSELGNISVKVYQGDTLVRENTLASGKNLNMDLQNGFYEVHFQDNGTDVAIMETVRIVKGVTTEIVLTEESYTFGFIRFKPGVESAEISDLSYYMIELSGSSNHKIKLAPEALSNINMIKPGSYFVTVKGYTADNKCVGHSSCSVDVARNKIADAEFVLVENTGNGKIKVTVNTAATFSDFKVVAIFNGVEKAVGKMVKDPQSNKWTCNLDIAQGWYSLQFRNGNDALHDVSSLRVIEGCDTVVKADIQDVWNVDITIVDKIGKTPSITFTPSSVTVKKGDILHVTALVSDLSNYNIEWRLDNEILSGQDSLACDYQLPSKITVGSHVLTLIVRSAGTVWSENLNVEVTLPAQAFSPAFSAAAPKAMTRGLHSLDGPTNYFGGNIELASSVMRDMPLMTSLKAMSSADIRFDFSSIPAAFYAYDQRLRIQVIQLEDGSFVTPCRVNEDGVFIRYDVLQQVERDGVMVDDVVGYLDYYYSWNEGAFSYRQYWVNTMEMNFGFGTPNHHNGYMLLEMTDIPIDMKSGDYSYGQLETVNGVVQQRKDTVHDTFFLGDNSSDIGNGPLLNHVNFMRSYPVMKSENGLMTSAIIGSNFEGTGYKEWTSVPGFNAIATKYDNGVGRIDNTNRDNFNIDFVRDITCYLYENGNAVASTDMRSSSYRGYTYKSFAEFNSHSLQKKNSNADIYGTHWGSTTFDSLVCFDYMKHEGVCGFYMHNHPVYGIAELDYRNMDRVRPYFDKFYKFNDLPAGMTTDIPELRTWYTTCYRYINHSADLIPNYEYVRQYFYQHLKKCGITDENYLENMLYYVDLNFALSIIYTKTGETVVVDGRNPSEYRAYVNEFIERHNEGELPAIPAFPEESIRKTYR